MHRQREKLFVMWLGGTYVATACCSVGYAWQGVLLAQLQIEAVVLV